jgi:HEPN domain-containing protein
MISVEAARRNVAVDLLELANRDAVAMRALAKVPEVDFSIIGFHAQQCVEKALKAALAVKGITFPRTHNLDE